MSHREPMCFLLLGLLKRIAFLIYHLAAQQQTLGYYHVDSHFCPTLITVFWHSWLVVTRSFVMGLGKNNLVSIYLSTVKYPLGFEPESFRCDCNVVAHLKLPLACNSMPWYDCWIYNSELRKIYTMMMRLAQFSK